MKTIYYVENLLNGKRYVGQTSNFKRRKQHHFNAPNRKPEDRRGQQPMYQDMRKYGVENFEMFIITTCEDDKANELEEFYIQEFDSFNDGYNLCRTTYAPSDPVVMDKIMTDDMKSKMSKRFKEMNKENWSNPEYREQRSKHSSQVQKERLKDPEYLKKKSDDLAKHWKKKQRQVVQYTLDGEYVATFKSMRDCQRQTGITIHGHLKNPHLRKQAGGFVFKYLDEVECRD